MFVIFSVHLEDNDIPL